MPQQMNSVQMSVHIMVHGLVTGVFFRDFVKKTADILELKGWVRNTEQGTIEIFAEGKRGRLEELIDKCKQEPPFAQVEKVNFKWSGAINQFKDFEIKY